MCIDASNLIKALYPMRTPGADMIYAIEVPLEGTKPPGFLKASVMLFTSSELNSTRCSGLYMPSSRNLTIVGSGMPIYVLKQWLSSTSVMSFA